MEWCTWKHGDKRSYRFYRMRYKRWDSNSLFYRDHGHEQFAFILFCGCQTANQMVSSSLYQCTSDFSVMF